MPHRWGRRRAPGHWALIYMAFVISGHVDIEPWWTGTEDELWRRAGFGERPSYTTTYVRFRELEQFADAFDQAAAALIALAQGHEPRVGQHVLVDSTEAETHASPVHDCGEDPACRNNSGTGDKAPKRPERICTDDHRRVRHEEAERDEDAPRTSDKISRREIRVDEHGREYLRLRIGKHWSRSYDPDAGARAYSVKGSSYKFWHGYYNQKGTDLFTGAPLAVVVVSASRQE
jgi:hypothetical protein